jgi:hypothetical protein
VKFILLVEGYTEEESLPNFLARWLNNRLKQKVRIHAVRFDGWAELVKDAPNRTEKFLKDPRQGNQIIAVIGLLDLYLHPGNSERQFYPADKVTADDRFTWAKQHIEKSVGNSQYRQFFAIHEVEAWLLSDTDLFDARVVKSLPGSIAHPETINSEEPPKKLLSRLYREKLKRNYKERVDGLNLFNRLNPEVAYSKCPGLKAMLDEMLTLAQARGL